MNPSAPTQQNVLLIFTGVGQKLLTAKSPEIVVLSTEQSFLRENDNHSSELDSNAPGKNLKKSTETADETLQNKITNFSCKLCPQSYKHTQSLARHHKADHPSLSKFVPSWKVPKVFNFSCQLCGKNFNKKYHYNYHLRNVHEIFEGSRRYKPVPCAYCKNPVETKSFVDHLLLVHNKTVQKEELKFPTLDHFIQWKDDVEKKTRSKFIKPRGSREKGTKKTQNYTCHRSGFYFCKGKGKRRLRLQGSCKMNKFCPAGMKVQVNQEGDCEVIFHKTHIGHMNDMGHYNLTSEERLTLAIKIAAEISLDVILDEVRESVTDSKPVRTHLLTERDIDSINNDLYADLTCQEGDAVSVDLWVSQMQRSENSCILFFKPLGIACTEHPALQINDFFLAFMNDSQTNILQKYGSDCICVDSTCAVGADGFELVTLFVMDNQKQAYPCAFLVSNKCDEAALRVFFSTVLKKCGKLSPRVFMSDVSEPFYNAWTAFHSLPEKRLHCSWLVDNVWRRNLFKIDDKEKKVWAYKMLSALLEELDKDAFERMLGQCVGLLTKDADTVEFGEYIRNQFATCKTSWAYCYRIYDELKANEHLERMHRTIKYIAEKVKHLDKSITAIMKFVRRIPTARLIETDKEKLTSRLKNLKNCHETCVRMSWHVVETEGGWIVTSDLGGECYSVKENNVSCKCLSICNECDICVHKYTCSCPDFTMQWNICEHIHSICKKTVLESEHPSGAGDKDVGFAISEESSESQPVVEQSSKGTHCQPQSSASMQERRHFLTQKISSWIETLSTPEEFEAFEKIIAPIPSTLAAMQSMPSTLVTLQSIPSSPATMQSNVKRILKPIRREMPINIKNDNSCSTKKVRISRNRIKKSTARKSTSILRKPIEKN